MGLTVHQERVRERPGFPAHAARGELVPRRKPQEYVCRDEGNPGHDSD